MKNHLVQKLRQASGANYMLCHQAADRVMKLQKTVAEQTGQINDLKNRLKRLGYAE